MPTSSEWRRWWPCDGRRSRSASRTGRKGLPAHAIGEGDGGRRLVMGRIETVRLYPTYPQGDMGPFMVLAHDGSNDAYSGEVLRGDAQAVPDDV